MSDLSAFFGVLGLFALIGAAYAVIVAILARQEARKQLEEYMHEGKIEHVNALLKVRSHLLRKEQRNEAEVWLAQKKGYLAP